MVFTEKLFFDRSYPLNIIIYIIDGLKVVYLIHVHLNVYVHCSDSLCYMYYNNY